mgnify:CR=1 FL=1
MRLERQLPLRDNRKYICCALYSWIAMAAISSNPCRSITCFVLLRLLLLQGPHRGCQQHGFVCGTNRRSIHGGRYHLCGCSSGSGGRGFHGDLCNGRSIGSHGISLDTSRCECRRCRSGYHHGGRLCIQRHGSSRHWCCCLECHP